MSQLTTAVNLGTRRNLCIGFVYSVLLSALSLSSPTLAPAPACSSSLQSIHGLHASLTQVKNLNPRCAASPGIPFPELMAPSTCSPRSSFLFSRTRMKRRIVAMMMAMKAVTEQTDIATTKTCSVVNIGQKEQNSPHR